MIIRNLSYNCYFWFYISIQFALVLFLQLITINYLIITPKIFYINILIHPHK